MLPDYLYEQGNAALWIAILLSALPLLASFVCGFLTALVQAATQIQDQALSFLPRLLAVGLTLWLSAPFLLEQFQQFVAGVYLELAHVHAVAG